MYPMLSSLPEQQAAFAAALLADAEPVLSDDFWTRFVEAPAQAQKRFAAYRRNVHGNWHAALAASFPVISTLLGRQVFATLAAQYRIAQPSRDADLNRYGERLAGFLAAHALAAELPYLPDLARLEWAIEAVYGAVDDAPLDFAKLKAVPPEQQSEIVLVLSSAVQEIASPWPLFEIWQAHQADAIEVRDAALANIDFTPQHNIVMVSRHLVGNAAGNVCPIRLSPGEARFRAACQAAESLDTALTAALAVEPQLDVAALLPQWLARGWIVDFNLPEAPQP